VVRIRQRKGLEFGLAGLNSKQVGISAARHSLAGHFAHLQPHSPLAPPPRPPLSGATEGAACFSPLSDYASTTALWSRASHPQRDKEHLALEKFELWLECSMFRITLHLHACWRGPSAGRTSFENSTAKISTLGSMRQAGRRVLASVKLLQTEIRRSSNLGTLYSWFTHKVQH
jgi:hypothetical protein